MLRSRQTVGSLAKAALLSPCTAGQDPGTLQHALTPGQIKLLATPPGWEEQDFGEVSV